MTNQNSGLAVVLLLANDPSRTAAFYRDVLGLVLNAEEHDGRPTHYACRLGSVYFTIQSRGDLGEPEAIREHDSLQLCFTVPSMDVFLEHLKTRQVAALHEPRAFEHTTFTTLLDPDGRHVRVMTPWQREIP
jgi:catechol 2,3-dioxygenase-like lactoylglutathione lyase family enzyme